MPTIEIISLNNNKGLKLNQNDYSFSIIEEIQKSLESHRWKFQKILKKNHGTIIHIGNPNMIDDKNHGFFAGFLIDWDYDSKKEPSYKKTHLYFKFIDRYLNEIDNILELSLNDSPSKRAYFLIDYQFGPKRKKIIKLSKIESFWEIHNSNGLRFNTLYIIK